MSAHTKIDTASARELLRFGRQERRPVEMRAYVVRSDKSMVDVRVLDLSYNGCSVETVTRFVPGETVTLSVLSCGIVRAKVRWCKGRKAGLLFVRERGLQQHRERCAERVTLFGEIDVRRTGTIGYRVLCFDLSRHGCKCEYVERPRIEEKVWVKFPGLESLEAQVCWVEGSECGLRFARPIHPAVFDLLLLRFPAGS